MPRRGALGLAPKLIEQALHSFAGLPHRSQLVGEKGGVRFINDSKATNVDSAAKALQAFPKSAGSPAASGKEGGIAALQPFLPAVVKAYLIGHSARDFALQIGDTPHEICETMDRAVARAAAEAEPGEVVLLAPAAASFDQYPNFEKRGEDFAARVKALLDGVKQMPPCGEVFPLVVGPPPSSSVMGASCPKGRMQAFAPCPPGVFPKEQA